MNTNVFNNSGAVTDLFKKLREKSILRFSSIDEIVAFKKGYDSNIECFKKKIINEITEEINNLTNERKYFIEDYNNRKAEQHSIIKNKIEQINTILQNSNDNIFQRIKKYLLKKKLNNLESNFDKISEKPLKKYLYKIKENENKIVYLTNNQNEELNKRAKIFLEEMEYINTELNNLSPLLYGSIGELKAINLLRELPNQYYIINDFREVFNPPLYNTSEGEKIFSTQIDHVVIGPTGVYVIETKYWSQKSIENKTFFSPIKQVKRGGFAVFIIINDFIRKKRTKIFSKKYKTMIFFKKWRRIKVSVSNILLMMHSSTNERDRFVEVLTESNFINYITRRPVVLSDEQIKFIVNRFI
jgi:hypothetical protein